MSLIITENSDQRMLAEALGAEVCEQLTTAINSKQHASLVVSGGSTPKLLFEFLRKQEINWEKVTITLADERCVDAEDNENNGKMIRQELLQEHASGAKFISLYDKVMDNHHATSISDEKIKKIRPPYDVVILGMGPDGHTASIFPLASNLQQALDLQTKVACLLVDPVSVTPLRITQTRKRLLNTNFLALHFIGDDKRYLFNSIIDAGQTNEYPISSFIHQDQTPLNVYCSPTRN